MSELSDENEATWIVEHRAINKVQAMRDRIQALEKENAELKAELSSCDKYAKEQYNAYDETVNALKAKLSVLDEVKRKATQLIRIADLISYVPYEEETPKLRLLRKRAKSLFNSLEAPSSGELRSSRIKDAPAKANDKLAEEFNKANPK